jgi:mannan endo-1,4-beta-mannosidase
MEFEFEVTGSQLVSSYIFTWSFTDLSIATKRQDNTVGAAFDGSQGVDSEDILNIPEIGFGSAQLFPDQNVYDPAQLQPSFENTVQTGIDWITRQAETGQA